MMTGPVFMETSPTFIEQNGAHWKPIGSVTKRRLLNSAWEIDGSPHRATFSHKRYLDTGIKRTKVEPPHAQVDPAGERWRYRKPLTLRKQAGLRSQLRPLKASCCQ